MKDFSGRALSKDEEIVVLRECIEDLKKELLRMRERQMMLWVEKHQSFIQKLLKL